MNPDSCGTCAQAHDSPQEQMITADQAAHALFDVAVTRRNHGRKCVFCGHPLQTAYHENRLYSVKCLECDIVVLVAAGNPGYAEDAIGKMGD